MRFQSANSGETSDTPNAVPIQPAVISNAVSVAGTSNSMQPQAVQGFLSVVATPTGDGGATGRGMLPPREPNAWFVDLFSQSFNPSPFCIAAWCCFPCVLSNQLARVSYPELEDFKSRRVSYYVLLLFIIGCMVCVTLFREAFPEISYIYGLILACLLLLVRAKIQMVYNSVPTHAENFLAALFCQPCMLVQQGYHLWRRPDFDVGCDLTDNPCHHDSNTDRERNLGAELGQVGHSVSPGRFANEP